MGNVNGTKVCQVRVCKFGGTSVANADCISRAIETVGNQHSPCLIVVSAMGGMTNRLIESAELAAEGQLDTARATAADFRRRHEQVIEELFGHSARSYALCRRVLESVQEFESICHSLSVLRERTPRILDVVLARGERLLAAIFAAALAEKGLGARYVDATDILFVERDGAYLTPDAVRCEQAIQELVWPHLEAGVNVVVPGFIASGENGEIVTLGRGGSDYSATILGNLLNAESVTLYKEVDGLLTADPRMVPDARVIPQLHYREAAELAYYGAKVLHPRTIIPLIAKHIPLHIKNSFQSDFPGTVVSAEVPPSDYPVKALTAMGTQCLFTIHGNGMLGVPGIAGRTFSALARATLSVSFISQASSESSICFILPSQEVERAQKVLRDEFRYELNAGLIEGVDSHSGMAVVAVVGLGMKGHTGVAARTLAAVARCGANVIAIAQGSSELNISIAIEEKETTNVLRALHQEYHLDELTRRPAHRVSSTGLFLYGFGQIGRALLQQIHQQSEYFQNALALTFETFGMADSKVMRVNPSAFRASEIAACAQAKSSADGLLAQGLAGQVAQFSDLSQILSQRLGKRVFVDCTASDSFATICQAVDAGCHIVLANKRPLAVSQENYDRLFFAARERGVHIRFEATVGAGLPVLDTLEKLKSSGDEVIDIVGCLSGTLGYLMTKVGQGQCFSEAVDEAYQNGFTEPDPRDDLSGHDVARKALILARSLGYRLDFSDIPVEPLYPKSVDDDDPKIFIQKLRSFDDEMATRLEAAAREKKVLRYVARIGKDGVRVGLEAVPGDSPLGMLQGTGNQVTIRSLRYKDNPLIVTGPGAGAQVTAAGVLNDLTALAMMDANQGSVDLSAASILKRSF